MCITQNSLALATTCKRLHLDKMNGAPVGPFRVRIDKKKTLYIALSVCLSVCLFVCLSVTLPCPHLWADFKTICIYGVPMVQGRLEKYFGGNRSINNFFFLL